MNAGRNYNGPMVEGICSFSVIPAKVGIQDGDFAAIVKLVPILFPRVKRGITKSRIRRSRKAKAELYRKNSQEDNSEGRRVCI